MSRSDLSLCWSVQAMRGMRTLPHLGSNPGNVPFLLWISMGAIAPVAQADGFLEWLGCAPIGTALMACIMAPSYLAKCVARANASDMIEHCRQSAARGL